LHIFDKLHELLSVNLVPKSHLPVIELILNECNHIPHILKENQFISAILKLLIAGLLDIEKNLKVVEFFSLIFKNACSLVVLFNLGIGSKDGFFG